MSKDRKIATSPHSSLSEIQLMKATRLFASKSEKGKPPQRYKWMYDAACRCWRDMLSFVILKPGAQILIGRDESADPVFRSAVSSRHAVVNYAK